MPGENGRLAMKRNLALILACLALSGIARPQDEPQNQSPPLLRQAAHCLVTVGPEVRKLLHGNPKELSLGYFLDTKSYPANRRFTSSTIWAPSSPKAWRMSSSSARRITAGFCAWENNAAFERRKKGIEFLEKPVGGVWTEEHLEDAIDRISQEPMYLFSVKDLREPAPGLRCESYGDTQ